MAKPNHIELPTGERFPILYEDRSVLAIDKLPGWLLAPESWQHTARNLQSALVAGMRAGAFWARARGLKYLRFIHRLDAETSGVLLLAKSPGALRALSRLFETRQVVKRYLAVVQGRPAQREWSCALALADDPEHPGRILTRPEGKAANTRFRLLATRADTALVEARPLTGRTHQIRVHLAAGGLPVLGDLLYGPHSSGVEPQPLALRAVGLEYSDPFTSRRVCIRGPAGQFLRQYGFEPSEAQPPV